MSFNRGRVAGQEKSLYRLVSGETQVLATIRGKLQQGIREAADLPVVGDDVEFTPLPEGRAVIESILPRRSLLARKEIGARTAIQPLAANVDFVLIANSLNQDFNPNRIERYLTLAWNSGAEPVIVLTKRDLEPAWDAKLDFAARRWPGLRAHAVSGFDLVSISALTPFVSEGRTAVVVGSSGVGKSTLINALIGRTVQDTGAIREADDRGRHTTTSRSLLDSPYGGFVIDTPGLREVQMTAEVRGLSLVFDDLEELATQCRFRDCAHQTEPGCALRSAIDSGLIEAERWENYQKLRREIAHQRRKRDPAARATHKAHWKRIHREVRRIKTRKE